MDQEWAKDKYTYIGVKRTEDEEGNLIEYLDRCTTNNFILAYTWYKLGTLGINQIDAYDNENQERLYCFIIDNCKP